MTIKSLSTFFQKRKHFKVFRIQKKGKDIHFYPRDLVFCTLNRSDFNMTQESAGINVSNIGPVGLSIFFLGGFFSLLSIFHLYIESRGEDFDLRNDLGGILHELWICASRLIWKMEGSIADANRMYWISYEIKFPSSSLSLSQSLFFFFPHSLFIFMIKNELMKDDK